MMMRLQFSSQKLYGRDNELAQLQAVYQQVVEEGKSKLVLLEGFSGNGKTSLVTHFGSLISSSSSACSSSVTGESQGCLHGNNNSNSNCCLHDSNGSINPTSTTTGQTNNSSSKRRRARFIKGKFDEQHQKPYAAFVQAFRDMIDYLIRHRRHEMECIEAIHQAVVGSSSSSNSNSDQQDQVLYELFPNLHDLFRVAFDSTTNHTSSSSKSKEKHVVVSSIGADNSKKNISSNSNKSGNNNNNNSTRMLEKMNQFQFRFKSFVRAVCTRPVVLFLDDLQWSDMSSLELLKAISSDGESRNLMIIGAYRGHEVHENHPLSWCILHFKNNDDYLGGDLVELELSDFQLPDLNHFLAHSLNLAPEKTLSLSQVVMKKTHGNVFHSKEFLQHLVEEKLIRYDMQYYQWTWNADEIAGATDLTENVVHLVASRIRQLPDNVIQILKIASCLWYSFDVPVLEYIVVNAQQKQQQQRQEQDLQTKRLSLRLALEESSKAGNNSSPHLSSGVCPRQQSNVMKGLLVATEHGLLDPMGPNGFKFAHDRIREATYSLIAEGQERDNLHMVIGELLWYMYHSEKGQQWMLFSAVDQLNKVSCHLQDAQLRYELAEVNQEAAESAIALSAFLPAIVYLKSGIQFLGCDGWDNHYPLCLALHSKLASLESSVGHAEESEQIVKETLRCARTLDDKLPVYSTLVESLGVQGKLREALALAFNILADLGEAFPKKTNGWLYEYRVRKDTAETRWLLQKHTDASILALPRLQDKRKQYVLKILNLVVDPAFHLGEMKILFLIINRMVRISLKYGLGDASGVAFALYGFGLSPPNGDRRENFRYGRLSLMIQEQLGAREWDCRVLVYVYVLLNHWQEPLQKSLDPLLSAHSSGMETGDIDYAFQSAGAFLTLYWYSGNDLKRGVDDMRKFCAQMREYKQEKALAIYLPLFQCMLNMTGSYENALLLAGEAISPEEFEDKKLSNSTIMSYQMQLAYYFDDIQLAETMSTKLQEVSKSFNAHYLFVARLFFFGLIALRVAFDTFGKKKKRNLFLAKRVIRELAMWTSHGGLNCLHKLLILKAELKALEFLDQHTSCRPKKQDIDSVRDAYDTAIRTAIRSGFKNDAALACERASVFFERSSGEEFWIRTYLSRAIEYYNLWGARAKVDKLTRLHESESMAFNQPSAENGNLHGHQFRKSAMTDHSKVRVKHSSRPSSPSSQRFSSGMLLTSIRGSMAALPSVLVSSANLSERTDSCSQRKDT